MNFYSEGRRNLEILQKFFHCSYSSTCIKPSTMCSNKCTAFAPNGDHSLCIKSRPLACSITSLLKLSPFFPASWLSVSTGSNTLICKHVLIFPNMSPKHNLFYLSLCHDLFLTSPFQQNSLTNFCTQFPILLPPFSIIKTNQKPKNTVQSGFHLYLLLLQKIPHHGYKITSLW